MLKNQTGSQFISGLLTLLLLSLLSPTASWAVDGDLKWAFPTGGEWSSPAIGGDGTVYVGSYDNNLYAINPDGTQKWVFTAGDRVSSSPAIGADGTVYVGSNDTKLYAINPDGSQKWVFATGGWVDSSPAIGADGTVYVGSYDDNLYAINPDGTDKWTFATGWHVRSSPAIGLDGTVYVGSYDDNLYAINPDGSQKWAFTTGDWVYSSPAIGLDGTVYVGSFDNNLYAINPDGSQKWAFTTGDLVWSSPAIGADGTVYVGSADSNLYAINPDGSQKWVFTAGDRVWSSPAIGVDGTVYVVSMDDNLYAIEGSSGGLADTPWPMFRHDLKHTGSVIHPPVADADGPYVGNEGESIAFDGTGSYDPDGTVVSYDWDFGDGDTGTGETPTHAYADNGVYTVTLVVTDDRGLVSEPDTTEVTVDNVAPTVDAGEDQTVSEGDTVYFDGSFTDPGSADTHTIEWDFGDGNTDTGTLTPMHVYANDGVYTVTLTVTDDDGGVGTDTLTVTVTCTMGVIATDAIVLDELRRFRDDRLSENETGKKLIHLYYHHSPEVAGILVENPMLSMRSAVILKQVMPGIHFLLGDRTGRDMVMSRLLVRGIQTLLADISAQGSDELADTLSMLSDVLDDYKGMRFSRIWR